VNCSWDNTKPTPGPEGGGGGTAGLDGPVAGFEAQAAARPAAVIVLSPVASCAKERRDIPCMGWEYPKCHYVNAAMPHDQFQRSAGRNREHQWVSAPTVYEK
jgi:hypothetical protein